MLRFAGKDNGYFDWGTKRARGFAHRNEEEIVRGNVGLRFDKWDSCYRMSVKPVAVP